MRIGGAFAGMLVVTVCLVGGSAPAGAALTSTTITLETGTTAAGIATDITALITPPSSSMTGTVSYTLDGSPVEGCQDLAVEYTNYESLVGCNITFTSTGEYTISANYSGSTSFGPSSTTSVEDVLLLATTTLTQSPATIVVGQAPTFIATVSGDGPTPTGASASSTAIRISAMVSSPTGECNARTRNTHS
jgi:hypothetical protein